MNKQRNEPIYCPSCGREKPFVGTDAEIQKVYRVHFVRQFAVVCPADEDGCGMSSGYYATEEEAIAAWNRRHIPKFACPKDCAHCPLWHPKDELPHFGYVGFCEAGSKRAYFGADPEIADIDFGKLGVMAFSKLPLPKPPEESL